MVPLANETWAWWFSVRKRRHCDMGNYLGFLLAFATVHRLFTSTSNL